MANITIQFKRGTKESLEEKLVPELLGVPARGEPIYETDTNRLKIGDGEKSYIDLDYFGNDVVDNLVLEGYHDTTDNSFYDKPEEDVSRKKLVEWTNRLYKDIPSGEVYYFKAIGRFTLLSNSVKLYNTHGQNVDGAMTQKATTDAITNIDFAVDSTEEECLTLTKPW